MATLKTKLLPHQERVVGKIQKQPGLVVAHGLGSGKTLSSIAAAVNIQPDHTQVLVPASLKANYEKEIKKHVRGTPPIRIGSLQHAALKGDPPKADMLVVDEAHRGRNPQSKTFKLIEGAKTKKRLLLTASPTYNRPSDVAALVNMAAGERVLPMGPEFEKGYVSKPPKGLWSLLPWVKKRPGLKNKAELGKHLSKWVDYHKSGGKDFPSVKEEKHEVEMSPRQTKLHDAAWGQLSFISKLRLQKGLPPEKQDLSKINQFQSQARQVSGTEASFVKGMPAQTSPKVLKAVSLLDDAAKANPNHRALVYSNYLGTLGDYSKELEKRKVPHAVFSGREKMKDRKQMVKDYNAGKLKALLVSSAGGEGLDLKGTRQVQVLEPHWNVEKLKQVEGRAIRKGSHSHLPKKEQNVTLQRFESYPRGGFFGKRRGVEQVLGDMAKNKELLNQELVSLMEKRSYKLQGHTEVRGIPIAIENKKGSIRKGTSKDGHKWETKMKAPYGYIKGTKGADGEEVDAFVGPDKEAPDAYVVHQHKEDGRGYDEDKVILGVHNKAEAKKLFLQHYDDPKFLGPIAKVSTERLRELVASKKKLVKISQVSYRAFLDEVMRCGGSF